MSLNYVCFSVVQQLMFSVEICLSVLILWYTLPPLKFEAILPKDVGGVAVLADADADVLD